MSSLKPSHTISANIDHAEIGFTIGGYWSLADMKQFLFDLGEAAKPLMKAHKPFNAIGDLRDFVPQDRETAAAIRDSILAGQKNGLRRFAVVTSAPLVMMQYRRITKGVEVEFFDTPDSARAWLRETAGTPAG